MNRHEARSLCTGASDLGILARRLRLLQGDSGEFAITAFDREGVLWADDAWWEIEPIGVAGSKESIAEAAFCIAWVIKRWFFNAGAASALDFARAAAADAILRHQLHSDSAIMSQSKSGL